jgi:hypothetical protein
VDGLRIACKKGVFGFPDKAWCNGVDIQESRKNRKIIKIFKKRKHLKKESQKS